MDFGLREPYMYSTIRCHFQLVTDLIYIVTVPPEVLSKIDIVLK